MITTTLAKGFQNKASGTKHTWYKSSFNMSVKNIFDDFSVINETDGILDAIGQSTSYDLSSFDWGWEVLAGNSVFVIYGPFGGGNIFIRQRWFNVEGIVMFEYSSYHYWSPIVSGGAYANWLVSNQGLASWEINKNGTYRLVASMLGSGIDESITSDIIVTGVPSESVVTSGMVWVEGDKFCWTSANGHIHKVEGDLVSDPGAASGMIWVETNAICWTGVSGKKFRGKNCFRQFSSIFSNGPSPGEVSNQSPGMFWMDTNFGYEHIGYIGNDGYKYVFASGENPYI